MGWRKKIFRKIKERDPYAQELADDKYRQRIKESDKNYTRKKLRVTNVHEYDEESAD